MTSPDLACRDFCERRYDGIRLEDGIIPDDAPHSDGRPATQRHPVPDLYRSGHKNKGSVPARYHRVSNKKRSTADHGVVAYFGQIGVD